jgi:hypothetical protein
LWVIFALLDPDPLTWLNPDPIRIRPKHGTLLPDLVPVPTYLSVFVYRILIFSRVTVSINMLRIYSRFVSRRCFIFYICTVVIFVPALFYLSFLCTFCITFTVVYYLPGVPYLVILVLLFSNAFVFLSLNSEYIVSVSFRFCYFRLFCPHSGVYILVENGYLFPPPLGNLYFFPKKTA